MRKGTNPPIKEFNEDAYVNGAKIFSRFVKRPEKYKNTEVILRVRMDGNFGGWRLREEVYKAFGFIPGEALFLNNLYTLGCNVDVDDNVWYLDCFADNEAADWIDENEVTVGTVFEGRFRLAFELVEKGAGTRMGTAVDARIANIILLEGIKIIKHGTPNRIQRTERMNLMQEFSDYFQRGVNEIEDE